MKYHAVFNNETTKSFFKISNEVRCCYWIETTLTDKYVRIYKSSDLVFQCNYFIHNCDFILNDMNINGWKVLNIHDSSSRKPGYSFVFADFYDPSNTMRTLSFEQKNASSLDCIISCVNTFLEILKYSSWLTYDMANFNSK